jgi:hypothetical protein
MQSIVILFVVPVFLFAGAPHALAQSIPSPGDSQKNLQSAEMLGILRKPVSAPLEKARAQCLPLPVEPPDDRLQGPHGDKLISTRCEVAHFAAHTVPDQGEWITAKYRWTSVFTAEDPKRGPTDTVTEEEAVVFDSPRPGWVRAVWHQRYETGNFAVWASITPELASPAERTILLSMMNCVNGTGGCAQEFLLRHANGRWAAVKQAWLDQVPKNISGRMLHGFHIEPATLRGEAAVYRERDPNCCPSQLLKFELALRGDALMLNRHSVVEQPTQ